MEKSEQKISFTHTHTYVHQASCLSMFFAIFPSIELFIVFPLTIANKNCQILLPAFGLTAFFARNFHRHQNSDRSLSISVTHWPSLSFHRSCDLSFSMECSSDAGFRLLGYIYHIDLYIEYIEFVKNYIQNTYK